MVKNYLRYKLIIIGLFCFDLGITIIGITLGLTEMNPIGKYVIEHWTMYSLPFITLTGIIMSIWVYPWILKKIISVKEIDFTLKFHYYLVIILISMIQCNNIYYLIKIG